MASSNYDRRARRVLALSDLFRPGVDYVKQLSDIAIASLQDQELSSDPDWIRRGAGPVESNFKVFTLTETDLVLHFPKYQVTAGAQGPQRVEIPLKDFAGLFRQR